MSGNINLMDTTESPDPETLDPQQRIDDAAGAVHYWRGAKLATFSFGRQVAFQKLGVVGRGNFSSLEAAVAIVFLCTLGDDKGVDLIERISTPDGARVFRRAMDAWADSNKVWMNSPAGKECGDIADAIWRDLESSSFEPQSTKDDKPSPSPNG